MPTIESVQRWSKEWNIRVKSKGFSYDIILDDHTGMPERRTIAKAMKKHDPSLVITNVRRRQHQDIRETEL